PCDRSATNVNDPRRRGLERFYTLWAKSSRAQKTPSSWNMATLLKKQWSLDRVISRSQKN
ncbi:hypothetical protein, partial [Pseudomonas orientalis]|uniref:hypothetical protein n=1 Tax=Pseudomonas orientalis TaxID=76758 RepID=UPI001A918C2F